MEKKLFLLYKSHNGFKIHYYRFFVKFKNKIKNKVKMEEKVKIYKRYACQLLQSLFLKIFKNKNKEQGLVLHHHHHHHPAPPPFLRHLGTQNGSTC